MADFLDRPNALATHAEVWAMLEWYDRMRQRNRWYRRLWRWMRGAQVVNYDPFRLQRLATKERPQ